MLQGMVLGACVLVAPYFAIEPDPGDRAASANAAKERTTAEWNRLSYDEFCECVDELKEAKNISALRDIIRKDVRNVNYAVSVYSRLLDDDAALALCKNYDVDDSKWDAAFGALSLRPREKVMDYIKEICHSGKAYWRVRCYQVCLYAGWDDLVCEATDDETDETPTEILGVTVGREARSYLEWWPIRRAERATSKVEDLFHSLNASLSLGLFRPGR